MSRSGSFTVEAQPLEAALRIFALSLAVAVGVPLLMMFLGATMMSPLIIFPFIWIAAWVWAHRRIKPKKHKAGDVMVVYGQGARSGLRSAYCLYATTIPTNLLALITGSLTLESVNIPYWSTPPVSTISSLAGGLQIVYAVVLLILIGVAAFSMHNIRREIDTTAIAWASPARYDTLAAAKEGKIVLGHEFEIVIQSPAPALAMGGAVGRLEGEVLSKTVLKSMGREGPYIIDLGKARNPNVAIVGPQGTGKTVALVALVVRLWLAKQIPSLIMDWTGEQVALMRDIGALVWSVPDTFKINLLGLRGKSPSQRTAEVQDALIRSLGDERRSLTPLQALEVGVAIDNEYKRCRILEDDPSTWTNPPPTMQDVIDNMKGKQAKGLYKGQKAEWVVWILDKLKQASIVFGEEPADFFEIALRIPIVLDLSPLGNLDPAKLLVIDTINRRIDEIFNARKVYDFRLLFVLDEAHTVFMSKSQDSSSEPYIVRNARFMRKFGIGTVFATHLISDFPDPILNGAAFVIALQQSAPKEVSGVKKWLDLSKPEEKIYASLPRGGCFIKQLGEEHPSLVKIQMLGEEEKAAAKRLTERLVPKDILKLRSPNAQAPQTSKAEPKPQTEAPEPPDIQYCKQCNRPLEPDAKWCDGCGAEVEQSLKDVMKDFREQTTPPGAKPPVEEPTQPESPEPAEKKPSEEMRDLSPLELRIHRALMLEPTTMRILQAKFPETKYEELLKILHGLHGEGLIQIEKIANLAGKGTTFYAALKAEWLQSESLEHRAMLDMIEDATVTLRPIRYPPTHADFPDLALELAKPKTAIEVETGRKKLTPEELDAWAQNVKERNVKHGYDRTIVIVPNAHIKLRYTPSCQKHSLELATMTELLEMISLAPPKTPDTAEETTEDEKQTGGPD